MDVRCENCQTEYELDESRLKPGGVTVKCTSCGHTFKVRKRTITNVGTAAVAPEVHGSPRARTLSSKPPIPSAAAKARGESLFDDDARPLAGDDAPTTVERQWLIRLENGEQKSCRELATLQQWIIAGVVTRESLISRTGKTWKRLGDVGDLGQYFAIADEARATRDRSRPASRPAPIKEVPGTIPGYSAAAIPGYSAPQAAGGTILPDDDDDDDREARTTRRHGAGAPTPPPVPVRGAARTPALGSSAAVLSSSDTVPVFAPQPASQAQPPPARRPPTTPPPPPPRRPGGPSAQPPAIPQLGGRATAMWATDGVAPESMGPSTAPFTGKLAAISDEPAFAGRVRMAPGAEASFDTGRVRTMDDDDDVLPARRGSRAGMVVLIMALLVMGAAAAVVYVFVIRNGKDQPVATVPRDAAAVVTAPPDVAAVVAVVADAQAPEQVSPLDAAHGELAADVEPRLRAAAQALDGKADAPSQAMRAHLIAQLAQDLLDRASVTPDKAAGDAVRKEAKQLVLDAATAAQRALKAAGDDAGANLAMAEVLRLQGKPARDSKRYLDTARAKADKAWTRDLALADALALVHDGKLDDARAAFTAIDQGDGKLETSNDVRARFHLALVLAAQNKVAEARPLADAVLAAQPEHAGARALIGKLETQVAQSDPLPPEDGKDVGKDAGKDPGKSPGKDPGKSPGKDPAGKPNPVGSGPAAGGGGSYDQLLASANRLAETSCAKAMELFAKALEQKPNGVEALSGMGYCFIDAKQFSSAFSKFRTALVVSPRYEPALRGVAEGYLQQGLKDRAIEAYKTYLEAYPDSVAAKKQLDRLGGGATPSPPTPPAPQPDNGGGPATPPPAPPPAPAPAPAPTTPDPGAGAGSG
jgi:predicted Zn finger-like uncharacterized protein